MRRHEMEGEGVNRHEMGGDGLQAAIGRVPSWSR
jgi:hypothetical protein